MPRLSRVFHEERAISFVEMMVATAIAGMVGALLLATLNMVTRVDRFTRQDSEALGELRIAADRFRKELRQARKIYDATELPASSSTVVHIWVDYNRNNQQDDIEQIIWRFETASGGALRLVRSSQEAEEDPGDDEVPFIQAVNLRTGSGFAYAPAPPATTVVTLTLVADVSSGDQPSGRRVRAQVRLRNAAA